MSELDLAALAYAMPLLSAVLLGHVLSAGLCRRRRRAE